MEKEFNKLVRDNIPNIIASNNEVAVTRVLDDEEYRAELYKKLKEECGEVIEASTSRDVLEELADVLEVVKAIAQLENKEIGDIMEIAEEKKIKRGGFEKRIYLEKTYKK